MFCIHCGAQLPDEAKFCWKCGRPPRGAPGQVTPTASPATGTGHVLPSNVVERPQGPAAARPHTDTGGGRTASSTMSTGRGLVVAGSLAALLAFVMPWASCAGMNVSGMDLANQSAARQLGMSFGGQATGLLWLVPVCAVALLGLVLATMHRVPGETAAATGLALLASGVGGAVSVLVILGILYQRLQLQQEVWLRPVAQTINLQVGGFIALGGFAAAFVGALLDRASQEADGR